MKVTPTAIPGVLILEPKVFGDERGFFMETCSQRVFDATVGRHVAFVQDYHSRSIRGVLRGLQYRKPPNAQGKLVRVVSGGVFDGAVDVRRSSPTFGHWVDVELNDENHRQLWLPPGMAQGFPVTSTSADFLHKTTDYYAPQAEACIRWDDETLAIAWPDIGEPPRVSARTPWATASPTPRLSAEAPCTPWASAPQKGVDRRCRIVRSSSERLPRVIKHPSDDTSADLELLRLLEQHPEYSQRQLSSALGISLGKTHYLLKALLEKGLVKAQNFRRADNKLAYLYVLTPSGARQKVQLTRSFLARKEQEFVSLREQIAALRGELSARPETAAEQEGAAR